VADRRRGFMVGIEGIDAVGKRTQTALLNSEFRARGLRTRTFSFPAYNTPIGREIRRFLKGSRNYPAEARHMLFAVNRWEKKAEMLEALSAADFVLVNRYSESNLAYGVSSGLPLDWLLSLESGLPKTDLVAVLDASPEALYGRRGADKDRFEENLAYQDRTRKVYLQLAERFGWKVVDASSGIDQTTAALRALVLSEAKGMAKR
jgi:dTMP kinase